MKALGWLVSPLLQATGVPKQKGPSTTPAAQRDDGRDAALRKDELLRRRGGAADMVTGAYGAEAPPGGKTQLGS